MNNFDPYDALVPIFRKTTIPKGTKQIASSVFIKNDMGYFLFTAAHVTDDLNIGKLLIPVDGNLYEIHGYLAHIDLPPEIKRSEDDIDFAYFKLSTPFAKELIRTFKPITGNHCDIITSSLSLKVCSVAGYPASKSNKKNNIHSSEIFAFTGVAALQETYQSLELSHSSNIVLHFDRKKAVDPENGKPFPTPGLKGVSGGGIFSWPDKLERMPPDWSERKLIGIFHTYKEREGLVIGTTLIPFLSGLTLGHMKNFGGYF
ncbi:hypothetical protein [Methylotuvimicrobium alcaliphilum]|uniref:Peptidase S1 domain-containing protein n=1 Tax=Methylotuvimicrobium alcaliphilum (strain DSM 19304 / NCIMB 14124 / VKM B-2133 / 20Z) TaxID=1091494 RepID=G4SUP9_META2|nr:hypothetical protein [Methylotuvimicrobium alcaliphilum]CCE22876.1 protein of unknown function [Methylotuvimicrobium alcaliphilum 20Z]